MCIRDRAGAVLEQPLHAVEIECRADAIPDEIQIETGELDVGDMIHVRDIPLPPDVTARTDPNAIVFVLHEPRVAEEEAPAPEAAETEEPEVIKRGAEEDTEASEQEGG